MDARKPQRRTLAKAERDARKFAQVLEWLGPFTDASVLADFYQRGEESSLPDGYPASSGGESSIGFARGVSDPTLRTILTLEGDGSWRLPADKLMDRLSDFQAEISEVHGIARSMKKSFSVVTLAAERFRGRQSALQGPCVRCGRDITGVGSDRARRGLCGSCSNRYYEERRGEESVPNWLLRTREHGLIESKDRGGRVIPVATLDDFTPGMTYSA